MLAAQYTVPLPADYDMSIIRKRVTDRGHLLDDREGPGIKAYLVQEREDDGQRNQYAPFYLWTNTGAAASFLWGGGGFSGIVNDFGRPAVSTWLGVTFITGRSLDNPPAYATLERRMMGPSVDPAQTAKALLAELHDSGEGAALHSRAALIDPTRRESAIFTLGLDRSIETGSTTYSVLHLSAPGLRDLQN